MVCQQPTAVLDRPNPFARLFQEIEQIAQATLRRSSYFELHSVSCDFSSGVLTLRGQVASYHLKQLAQSCVADVPGVIEVHNHLEVVSARVPQNRPSREPQAAVSL